MRLSTSNSCFSYKYAYKKLRGQSLMPQCGSAPVHGPLKLIFLKKFLNVQCFLLLDVKIFSCKLFDSQECFLKKLKKDVGSA